MAAAVAAASPAVDNRCVGGGESRPAAPQSSVAPLPTSAIPALTSSSSKRASSSSSSSSSPSGRRHHRLRDRARAARSATTSCSSASASSSSSSSDEDGGGNGIKPSTAQRLEDLQHLVDLDELQQLDRHPQDASADLDNVAAELRQKNKDLVLAARLGKALLAKNDELSLMNERLAEEYGDKLEEIEQDRHRLRRQLAQARAECEQRCHELQADLKDLQAVLENRERQLREADKQKRAVVRELTDQNGRLQSHIRELSNAEAELRHKCRLLEDSQQHGSGKWNGAGSTAATGSASLNGVVSAEYGSLTPDDYRSLDVLRDEIDMKAAEKQRLQKRMTELRADRDRLAELLELKDRQLAECRAEANHYEHRSAMLAKQLDDALCSGGTGDWRGRGGKCASCQTSALETTPFRTNGSSGGSQPMSLLAELEQAEAAATNGQRTPGAMVDVDLAQRHDLDDGPTGLEGLERWAARLCDMLERHDCAPQLGNPLPAALSANTRDRLLKLIGGPTVGGGAMAGTAKPNAVDLAELVRNRDSRVAELTCEMSVRDAELQAAREERDLAVRDKMDAMLIQCVRCNGSAGNGDTEAAASSTEDKDTSLIPELLRKAWEQRDGAVRRKNAVQVQLARTRVDVLQANGQLMEAIGQKVELSQQLEQWQMDMQALLDEQMRRKLLAPPQQQSTGAGAPGGNQQKSTNGGGGSTGGGFPSMTASSLGSLGSSGLMNSLLMIAGGGGGNASR